jgi:glycosyltransferase involved in cell wall biosynthesis
MVYNLIIVNYIKVKNYLFDSLILFSSRLFSNFSNSNNEPLVSIIIATYNRSDILVNRTLPSVLSQTYKNIEVIIVGDKCIDKTPALLENYSDSRVYFYDLPKRGKYPSNVKDRWFVQGTVPRNKGMSLAKGEWFVFISDDDIMLPNHVSTLLKAAIKQNVEFISASYETVKNGKKIIVKPQPFGRSSVLVGGMQTWLYRSYLKSFKWNIHSWRKKWNKPVDYDLQNRFINAGVKIGVIDEIVYFNPPVHGTNTTGYEAAVLAENL